MLNRERFADKQNVHIKHGNLDKTPLRCHLWSVPALRKHRALRPPHLMGWRASDGDDKLLRLSNSGRMWKRMRPLSFGNCCVDKKEPTKFWDVVVTLAIVGFLGYCLIAYLGGRGDNCHVDWDGRSNPTVCD